MYKNTNPIKGFSDITGLTAYRRHILAEKFRDLYLLNGYQEFEIPSLEYQTLFSSEFVGTNPWPGWHPRSLISVLVKDYSGAYEKQPIEENMLFLIPEGTASICRNILSQYKTDPKKFKTGIPHKYFYISKCYRNELINELKGTKRREFTQIGIEYLGSNSIKADIEVFLLVIDGLRKIGFRKKDIRIRISDVRLFNELVEKEDLTDHQENKIKSLLDKLASQRASNQNFEKTKEQLLQLFTEYSLKNLKAWKSLLHDYIDTEDLESFFNTFSKDILKCLKSLQENIPNKYKNNIVFDPAVVRGQDYYNSTIFQIDIITPDQNISEIGGGGRYDFFIDRLLGDDRKKKPSIPATGMAYSLERIYYALDKYIQYSSIDWTDILAEPKGVVIWSKDFKKARKELYKQRRNREYNIVEVCYSRSKRIARKYANEKGFNFVQV
jgi:histidyl-tRNA synthetase